MKKLKGKHVLVYGLGGSGVSACRLLHTFGACVSVYDDDKKFHSMFCFVEEPLMHKFDMVVVSPGVKVMGNIILSEFMARRTPIISEIDLGSIFCLGKLIAVTGTNGKTTVCSLLGKIFDAAGKKNFVCGNIGLPISSIALKTDKESFVVCETSNFQLETSKLFSPSIACLLNIKPDHIDRHGSFEQYKRVKEKIFQNFHHKDIAVVNFDDEEAKSLKLPKKVEFFSQKPLKKGVFLKNGCIYYGKTRIMPASEVPLIGEKNMSNVMAAVLIACKCKIKPKTIRNAVLNFTPPPHRLEFFAQINGVKYIDDSKSTNIACTQMALESLNSDSIILLLGGQNKDLDFASFFANRPNIKRCVCFGQANQIIHNAARDNGYKSSAFATLKEATLFAKKTSRSGDIVLLSPACTSFDEFSSYAVRGQIFKELVKGEG